MMNIVSFSRSWPWGDVIQNTGGLCKVRWAVKGKGKRSGVRVIYYHKTSASQIRLLLIYKKASKMIYLRTKNAS